MGASCTILWYEEILNLRNLFLWNCLSDFELISQEYSLGDPFQKVFAKFWSANKNGSVEWGIFALYGHSQFLKNLLFRNRWSYFEIISQKCSLSDLSQKLLRKFWSVIKHGSSEWGLLSRYGHELILKKSSWKPLVRFWYNFIEMFIFRTFFVKFWSISKHGIIEWGLLALCKHKEILVSSSSLKATKKKKKKLSIVFSKIHVSDPGPSWPSCSYEDITDPSMWKALENTGVAVVQ